MNRSLRSLPSTRVLLLAALLASPASAAEPSVLVRTAEVRREAVSAELQAYGRVEADPNDVTAVNLPRAGLVDRLWVRLGQRVDAGARLLELDTAPQASMEFEQARAAVDYARSDLRRKERLLAEQLATKDEVAAARRSLRDAEAKLRAQERLGTGKARQVVHAPFAGIVTKLEVTQGQRVPADATALLLARRSSLLVPLGVEPEDARRVQAGMKVSLRPVFQPKLEVEAEVFEVHAMIDPSTRLVDVLVRVGPPGSDALLLGMPMEARITLKREEGLTVPRAAVLLDSKGAYLYVVKDGTAHRVEVTRGVETAERLAVSGALKAGDEVVVVGNHELKDGMAVRVSSP